MKTSIGQWRKNNWGKFKMFEEYEYSIIPPNQIKKIFGVWKVGRVLRVLEKKGSNLKCIIDLGNTNPLEVKDWIPISSINKK